MLKTLMTGAALFVNLAHACGTRSADAAEPVNGLTAELFATTDLDATVLKRIDSTIDHFWEEGVPDAAVPEDAFSIRWSGWIKPPKAGRYRFTVIVDDGVRLKIDGETVIDRWESGQRTTDCSLELTSEPHALEVEYFESGGPAFISLHWQPPGEPHSVVVPREVLFVTEEAARAKGKPRPSDKTGLQAEYYADAGFRKKLKTSEVWRLETVWGEGAPLSGLPSDLAVRYTGVLVAPESGQYKIRAYADNALRMWVDKEQLLECNHDQRRVESAVLELKAGQPVALKVEFVDSGRAGAFFVHWISPEGVKETSIPAECFYQSKVAAQKATSPAPGQ